MSKIYDVTEWFIWDYKSRKYKPYKKPKGAYTPLLYYKLEPYINCCACGKEIEFSFAYSSLKIHTNYGLAANICEKCHEKEIKEEIKHIDEEVYKHG